jgi:hypothetical protein
MYRSHRTLASLNRGSIPTIACFNRAKTPLGIKFDTLIHALQAYVSQHVAPVWGTTAQLVERTGYVTGAWALVFLDDADAPGALAYHDLTPDGLPQAKVFVRTLLESGETVSGAASHELVEMLVDPGLNLLSLGPDGTSAYAYESADPVEELHFPVNGWPMSDFVYPAYFEAFHAPSSVLFDHLGLVRTPFEILPGGYQSVFKDGAWTEFFGSTAKRDRFVAEDRRGHRSEQRASGALVRADVQAMRTPPDTHQLNQGTITCAQSNS